MQEGACNDDHDYYGNEISLNSLLHYFFFAAFFALSLLAFFLIFASALFSRTSCSLFAFFEALSTGIFV